MTDFNFWWYLSFQASNVLSKKNIQRVTTRTQRKQTSDFFLLILKSRDHRCFAILLIKLIVCNIAVNTYIIDVKSHYTVNSDPFDVNMIKHMCFVAVKGGGTIASIVGNMRYLLSPMLASAISLILIIKVHLIDWISKFSIICHLPTLYFSSWLQE